MPNVGYFLLYFAWFEAILTILGLLGMRQKAPNDDFLDNRRLKMITAMEKYFNLKEKIIFVWPWRPFLDKINAFHSTNLTFGSKCYDFSF